MNTSPLQISMRKTIDRQHNEIAEMEPLLMELGKLMEKMEVEITELKANSVPIDRLERVIGNGLSANVVGVSGLKKVVYHSNITKLIKEHKK